MLLTVANHVDKLIGIMSFSCQENQWFTCHLKIPHSFYTIEKALIGSYHVDSDAKF